MIMAISSDGIDVVIIKCGLSQISDHGPFPAIIYKNRLFWSGERFHWLIMLE